MARASRGGQVSGGENEVHAGGGLSQQDRAAVGEVAEHRPVQGRNMWKSECGGCAAAAQHVAAESDRVAAAWSHDLCERRRGRAEGDGLEPRWHPDEGLSAGHGGSVAHSMYVTWERGRRGALEEWDEGDHVLC